MFMTFMSIKYKYDTCIKYYYISFYKLYIALYFISMTSAFSFLQNDKIYSTSLTEWRLNGICDLLKRNQL